MKLYAKYQNGFEYIADDDIICMAETYDIPVNKIYDVVEYLENNNIHLTFANLEDIISILK